MLRPGLQVPDAHLPLLGLGLVVERSSDGWEDKTHES